MRIFLLEQPLERTNLRGIKQKLCQKRPRLKLRAEDYKLLHRRVLERDGWRCQNCGSSKDLHVHHLAKRSKLGDDALDNLIVLCANCHKMQHAVLKSSDSSEQNSLTRLESE